MTQPVEPVRDEPGGALKERLSTLIDVVGVLAVAAGVSWGLFAVLGPYAVAVGGVIVIGLNLTAGLLRNRPERAGRAVPVSPAPAPPPGPTSPGTLHVSGR